MKRNLLFIALAAAAMTMASCSKDATEYAENLEVPAVQTLDAAYIRANGTSTEIDLPEGGNYALETDADWLTVSASTRAGAAKAVLSASVNEAFESRRATVRVMDAQSGAELYVLPVVQSVSNVLPGALVFQEIFYTSNALASTGKPATAHGDQYFMITNNSDDAVDISGLMIMEAKINSTTENIEYTDDIRSSYTPVQTVYCIPADNGKILGPGEYIIVANNAQDHTPDSFDLTAADYEWFDESTVSSMTDIDNKEVPNLDIWFTYTKSLWILHDRGFLGYAIAMPPADMTKEQFLATYKWEGTYINHTPKGDYTMKITNAYKVPNDWVVDAVNLSVPGSFYTPSFGATVDAGWTYCGSMDQDPDRYGKCVQRKYADDGMTLVDTNNSTNDFIPNATPSL